jgi:lysyl-tRNA synthetase, class I
MSTQVQHNNRFVLTDQEQHWSLSVADTVQRVFGDTQPYTCAAGISPSGVVHFGNFRDVMTSFMVAEALRSRGNSVRFIFSWDDFDRFRKVPNGIPESFRQYIGRPLVDVPDPLGTMSSYARRFESEFEQSLRDLGIEIEFRYQADEYRRGTYDDLIHHALIHRREIADILLSNMSEKGKQARQISDEEYTASFYPVSVYSRFSGTDNTQVLAYNEDSHRLTYRCLDTEQDDEVDLFSDRIAKLAWKVDWPMRWKFENVVFEPGGHDHASPGGSYDVSSLISEQIYGRPAPVFVGYQFVGLRGLGVKMSGSSGLAVPPAKLLEIYEPALLKWLYARKLPEQGFVLAFDAEIIRQYDEYDREVTLAGSNALLQPRRLALDLSSKEQDRCLHNIPFRQAAALGQIIQWDAGKVSEISTALGLNYSDSSIHTRLQKARAWLEMYNPHLVLKLRDDPNHEYASSMSEEALDYVHALREQLTTNNHKSVEALETLVYAIPKDPSLQQKENAVRQRTFFKDVYNLLLSTDTGPRLSTFLWAVDRGTVLKLLDI